MSGVPNANAGPSIHHTTERYRELVRLTTRIDEIERRLEEIDNEARKHWYQIMLEHNLRRRPGYKTPAQRKYICPCCHEIVVLRMDYSAPRKTPAEEKLTQLATTIP